jgi:hypothetical protein
MMTATLGMAWPVVSSELAAEEHYNKQLPSQRRDLSRFLRGKSRRYSIFFISFNDSCANNSIYNGWRATHGQIIAC